jgi:hypothetical protein
MSLDSDKAATLSLQLAEQIAPLLAGWEPAVQGAALADLLARWLAGHFTGDRGTTKSLRDVMLAEHIRSVVQLIDVNEAQILARLKHDA